jgi:hypothetical protein
MNGIPSLPAPAVGPSPLALGGTPDEPLAAEDSAVEIPAWAELPEAPLPELVILAVGVASVATPSALTVTVCSSVVASSVQFDGGYNTWSRLQSGSVSIKVYCPLM